ncbi:hypothetical protein FE257_002936 [Aspergillus nanangensis]|uniref:Developmental regulatory protein wetA n=1 Tax=Aspergillus nanangensis TaxID=2582783 RepID=A0AAD4GWJ9_ASPNN|nr:hypothetical protein FE257_002936 [Aspergillus nanangensis]
MFAQPFDHSFNDLFSQYVDMDPTNPDGNKDVSFSGDLDQIFSLDSLSSDCGDHSPTLSTSKPALQSPQSWGKDLWCMPQEAVSPAEQQTPLAFQDNVHPPAVSDLSVNLDASAANRITDNRSPSTPPTTPSRKSKSALVTPKSIRRHREPNDRRALLRKQSSPSLNRSSQLQKQRMAYPEAWAQRFQNFSYRNSDDRLPLSPPPSDILVQHENLGADSSAVHMNHPGDSAEMPHHFDSNIFTQSPAISMPSPSTGVLGRPQRYINHSNNSTLTSSPPSADDIFSSPHSSDPQSMSSWHSDSLGTAALPFTPDLHSHDAQAWWSPMTSRVPQRHPSYQQMVASPVPQRPLQNSNNQHDMLQGGLMIQLDPSQFDMSGAPNSSFPSSSLSSAPNTQESHPYNHPAVPTPQKFVDSSSFNVHTTSRSPSLSPRADASPKDGSMMRNGAIMKTSRRSNGNGRKLSGHSMSAPKPAKGPSVSPKNKSVTVSFVNFTPSDSKKILTGVAPSGSSKTKARREQEARDRRRKLSEAALNAVRKAGGDVDALEAVFC